MSQFSNKIGMLNTNSIKLDDMSEIINNSLQEKFSSISSESSKLVLERLAPLLQSNQEELNSLNENLARLKNNYNFCGAKPKVNNFKNKSEEIACKMKKIKRQIIEDNEFVQMQDINSSQNNRNNYNFSIGLNQCLNNMDEVFDINSGKYDLKNVSEYSDKLSQLTDYFLAQTKSLESSIASQFENGLSQREELREKLRMTLNKLHEIRLYFNNNKNLKFRNHLIEKENFNFLTLQSQMINPGINNPIHIPYHDRNFSEHNNTGNIQYSKFSAEDFSFYEKN